MTQLVFPTFSSSRQEYPPPKKKKKEEGGEKKRLKPEHEVAEQKIKLS